jgi:porin
MIPRLAALDHRASMLLLLPLLAGLGGARAEEPPPPASKSWLEGEKATGTWSGGRTWLEDHGLRVDLDYTSETWAGVVVDGGDGFAQRGTVDLTLTLDTAKMSLWDGGTLVVFAENEHGDTGISDVIGSEMLLSNLEAAPFTQISELWYQQSLFAGRLRLKIGKQDANRDFASPRFPGNFIHNSFGVLPTIPMPSFPTPGVGAVVFVDPSPSVSLRAGAYESAPRIESLGLDTAFANGAVVVAQATVRHDLQSSRPLGAVYSLGAWVQTDELTVAGNTYSGNYGGFAVVDLLASVADQRTVQAFVRAGWAPPDRSAMTTYVGGGVTYHGLRGNDTVGLGASHARFPGVATHTPHSESTVELFYKLRLAAWFTVEPDLQMIVTPSGADDIGLAAGLRVKLKL